MNNKIALESLALDLRRVALGYHRNSLLMAERFYQEALKRESEIDYATVKPYLGIVLQQVKDLRGNSSDVWAENALVLSVLIQNYTQKFLS